VTEAVPTWMFFMSLFASAFGGAIGTGLLSVGQWLRAGKREQALQAGFAQQAQRTTEHFDREIERRDGRIRELEVTVGQLTALISEMNPKAALMFAAQAGGAIHVGGDAVARDKSG
jgi:hypothetical protein